jgi:hypothetical protein
MIAPKTSTNHKQHRGLDDQIRFATKHTMITKGPVFSEVHFRKQAGRSAISRRDAFAVVARASPVFVLLVCLVVYLLPTRSPERHIDRW